jgi:transcription initiation factor IIE alpha subunit
MKKNKKQIESSTVTYICPSCKTKEEIPRDVVNYFDIMDGGNPLYPPKFDCEKCNGKMTPIYYVNHDGIVYEYKE